MDSAVIVRFLESLPSAEAYVGNFAAALSSECKFHQAHAQVLLQIYSNILLEICLETLRVMASHDLSG